MKTFLLDLWHDLREKRLAPVAAVLLLGLVAVPVLLAKPAEEPDPAPVATSATPKKDAEALAALAKVKLGEEDVASGSTLGVFDPDNPFKPPKGAMESDQATAASGSGPADSSSGATTGGKDSSAGGPPSGAGGPQGAPLPGGTTGGTPGGIAPGGTAPNSGKTQTVAYKYVVDITFSANDRTRRIKGLEKLDMLPSESSPLLIFMGVTPKGSDAVFLVDSTLEAAGEGRCKPSPSECAFAYVGAGSEYVFTEEDGDSYTLRVDEIRKVKLSAGSSKSAKARASVGPHRRFVPPIVADLVVVASDSLENSNSDSDSR